MKIESSEAKHEFTVVFDKDEDPVLAIDHRGVFLLVDWTAQKVGVKGREELDDQMGVLVDALDANRLREALNAVTVDDEAKNFGRIGPDDIDLVLKTIAALIDDPRLGTPAQVLAQAAAIIDAARERLRGDEAASKGADRSGA